MFLKSQACEIAKTAHAAISLAQEHELDGRTPRAASVERADGWQAPDVKTKRSGELKTIW